MPIIAPFHGLRYNLKRVGSLAKVVTPPYDIISPKEQDAFYRLHPNNFIRVVYGKESARDNEKENRYSRAKKTLDEWLSKGVLQEEGELSVYPHLEEYTLGGKKYRRWGVIALVRLDSAIYHHEHTRPRPITDRLRLLETLQAPLSPILGQIPDQDTAYLKFITSACRSKKPAASVRVKGVRHAIWKVSDPAWIKRLAAMLDSKELVIADGRASRSHARIELRQQHFVLVDCSTNGTYVVTSVGNGAGGDGHGILLRREETVLHGSGRLSFGQPWQAGVECVEFQVLE